jgi:heptosyltransferase-2
MIDVSKVDSVVVRLPNWIGDAVMALPAVRCIKSSMPHLHVSCLGKPSVNELYRYNTDVDRLIDLSMPKGRNRLSAIKDFSKGLRDYRFDLGMILPDSFSSALIFKLAGVKRRIGYRSELRSFLLTDPVAPPETVTHRSYRYVSLVRRIGGTVDCALDVAVPVSDQESGRADSFLRDLGDFVVVCPTSRAPSRRWGRAKYAELIRRISHQLGLAVVIAGAADESSAVEEVGRLSGVDCLNLAKAGDLLLSIEVMRRSEVFVGNDSGASHLAAASGTRVISISGADDPDETRPLAAIGVVINKNIECSPCVKNVCPRKDHVNECMDVISVDDVFQEVEEVLNREK